MFRFVYDETPFDFGPRLGNASRSSASTNRVSTTVEGVLNQVLQVFIFQDGQFLGTEMATGERIEIGRDPSCGVTLNDESCSRKHALLFFHEEKLAIQDLGSANGTLLNKQPITGPRLVSPRDEVGIGRYQLKLKMMESQLPGPAGMEESPATVALMENPAAAVARSPSSESRPAMPDLDAFSSEEGDPTLIEMPGQSPSPYSLDSDPTISVAADSVSATAPGGGHGHNAPLVSSAPSELSSSGPVPVSNLDTPNTQFPFDADATATAASPTSPLPPATPTAPLEAPLAATPASPVGSLLDDLTLVAPASEPMDPSSIPRTPVPPPVPPVSGPVSAAPAAHRPAPAPAPASAPAPMDALSTTSGGGIAEMLEPPGPDLPPPAAEPAAPLLNVGDGAGEPLPVVNWAPGDYEPADGPEPDDEAPGWSLVQRLVRAIEPEPDEKVPAVEVIHYRGEQVFDQATLLETTDFDFGRVFSRDDLEARGIVKPVQLVSHKTGHIAEVVLVDGLTGRVLREGQQVDIRSLPEASGGKIPLTDGDLASLELGGDRIFIRFSRAVKLPGLEAYEAELKKERRRQLFAGLAAAIFVLVGGVTSWVYQYRALKETVIQLEDDGFAEVKKEIELEFKKPKPKAKPTLVKEAPKPKDEPKVEAKPEPKVAKKEAPKPPGVLDALKNLPSKKAGAQSLTKALNNVKGVKVPGASGYKVSAMTAKGIKGVSIGGASGGVNTSSLNSILKKGGGPGKLTGRSKKKVKGRVKTLKRKSKIKGRGTLSREEIQKVVRSLVGKIQYCYEKQLRTNGSLAGKVVLEWTIQPSGRVGVVKTGRGTSLKSAAAISCMQSKLKGAKFPKPRGGSVIVTYPFIFNTL